MGLLESALWCVAACGLLSVAWSWTVAVEPVPGSGLPPMSASLALSGLVVACSLAYIVRLLRGRRDPSSSPASQTVQDRRPPLARSLGRSPLLATPMLDSIATTKATPPVHRHRHRHRHAHTSASTTTSTTTSTTKSAGPASTTSTSRPRRFGPSDQPDVIIVGGGAAGCVLADRLSADGTKLVLMIESGNAAKGKYVAMPYGVLKLFKSEMDWDFQTAPEPHLAGDNASNGIYLCRGKVVGGSTCTNIMLYHRGDANDYDAWEGAHGCEGWGADAVLPYFKQAEGNNDTARLNGAYHNADGPMRVSDGRYQNDLFQSFESACEAAGFGRNDDFNDWSRPQEGYGRPQVYQHNGRRTSTATSYLARAAGRPNLRVLTDVHTNQLILRPTSGADRRGPVGHACVGVECVVKGVQASLRVADGGEVIVCAGAIGSPHLLMLSGVGPAAHLQEAGVPVRVDLPGVGQRLQDHPAAVVSFETGVRGVSVTDRTRIRGTTKPNPVAVAQWLFRGNGPLTSVGCDMGGFFKVSPAMAAPTASPDLQMRFLSARALNPNGMTTFTEFLKTGGNLASGFSMQSVAVRARSLGHVQLASADPTSAPLVTGNYLSDPADLVTLRNGIKLARRLGNSEAFASYAPREVFPGEAVQSDEQIDEYIRGSLHTANALVGTCRMGAPEDQEAVVDCRDLRVYGVAGLRVIDASVMPQLPGGQTASSTVMVAEKAASEMFG